MVSCWKMAERSRDWFSPVREPEFWPKTWFCAVDWTPVANVGDTLTRRKELLLLFQRWSSRADHRLVFSVTGKFPLSEASGTKDVGNGAIPAGTTEPFCPTLANPLQTKPLICCPNGHGTGIGNSPSPGRGVRKPPESAGATSPRSLPVVATLAADPMKAA